MSPPLISVCILAGHSPEALDDCLSSLRAQGSPPVYEVLIGGDPTLEALAVVQRHFPTAHVCRTPGYPGAARNPLVEQARGELLLFLDDDVIAPVDLLANLAHTAECFPAVQVFGGPNDTPLDSSRFQVVQGAVLSSLIGAGPVARRYGARHSTLADERWFMLCNLAVRREAMAPFRHDLICAEENALLGELRRAGGMMRYEPSLRVFHARRPEWESFARQMTKYGRGRGELLRRDPGLVRLAYLVPSGLLVYLVLALVVVALGGSVRLTLLPGALYGGLAIATAGRIAWTTRRLANAPLAAGLLLTLHACYGFGVLRGACGSRSRRWPAIVPPRTEAPAHRATVREAEPISVSD